MAGIRSAERLKIFLARVLLCYSCMTPLAIILALAAYAPGQHFGVSTADVATRAPAIVEVQKKAIEHARLEPSEITSWKKRVRYKALLPRFQVEYERRLRYDVNVDVNDSVYVGGNGVQVGPEDGGYSANRNNDQNVVVKAVWDFSETIFNTDMLAVSEETRLLARERQAVLAEVNRNYYERERVLGDISRLEHEIRANPKDEKIRQEVFAKQVAFDEATAALDAMTGGWFSRQTTDHERR